MKCGRIANYVDIRRKFSSYGVCHFIRGYTLSYKIFEISKKPVIVHRDLQSCSKLNIIKPKTKNKCLICLDCRRKCVTIATEQRYLIDSAISIPRQSYAFDLSIATRNNTKRIVGIISVPIYF